MMFCPNCGKEVAAGIRFCTNCGHPVGGAPAVPSASAGKTTPLLLAAVFGGAVMVIIAFLLVVVFLLMQPGQWEQTPQDAVQSEVAPDSSEALVGTWTNKDGVEGFGSDDFTVSYTIVDNTLYIEIFDYPLELTKK